MLSQPDHKAPGQVSVIMFLLSGKRKNKSKDATSVVKTPSSVSAVTISLKYSTVDQLEPKGWWHWPFLALVTSINQSLDSIDLFPNSMLNFPLLKSLPTDAHTFSLKLPQFCSLGRHCLGKDDRCSTFLQQVINSSFCQSSAWLCFFGLTRTKKWTQFLGNKKRPRRELGFHKPVMRPTLSVMNFHFCPAAMWCLSLSLLEWFQRGLVESHDFHHHPREIKFFPLQSQWRPLGRLEFPFSFISCSNKKYLLPSGWPTSALTYQ